VSASPTWTRRVLTRTASTTPTPHPQFHPPPWLAGGSPGLPCGVRTFPAAGTPLAEAYAATDWAATALGPPATWSDPLRTVVDVMMGTEFPITLLWGPEFVLVYNQPYVPLIGDKHPGALGTPAREVFPEAWDLIGPMLETARSGTATWVEDQHVPLHRRGFLEECYFTFSYSPVVNAGGEVEGVMDIAAETTDRVLSSRRLALLTDLRDRLADAEELADIVDRGTVSLRTADQDLPGVEIRLPSVPVRYDGQLPLVHPTGSRSGEHVETGPEGRIVWLPLDEKGDSHLRVALSPQLAPDEDYLDFLRLVAASFGQAVERVGARRMERETADAQRTMSEAFQRSLLPVPLTTGALQVAVRYQAALEVAHLGGDWYDWFELPDSSLALVIGDVAGHDEYAAASMAQVRNILRGVAYTHRSTSPCEILRSVDHAMLGTTRALLATGLLARVAEEGSPGGDLVVEWSNAGHPPPVLVDSEGRTRLLDTEPDLLLGLDRDTPRHDHQVSLSPGATLVLYTDGLIERRGSPLAQGLQWLVDLLRDTQQLSAEQVGDYLLENAGPAEDDVALVVLRA
jgi:serine phosphatase RsbU (regulator of sigma subunit)